MSIRVVALRAFRVRELVVEKGSVAKLSVGDAALALESGRGELVDKSDMAQLVAHQKREVAAALKAEGRPSQHPGPQAPRQRVA